MGRLSGSRRCLFPSLTPVAKLVLDFYNKKYSLNGVNYDSVLAVPGAAFSNATGGYVQTATGLQAVPPNTPRIGNNGYVSEVGSTNLLSNSVGLVGTGWNGQNTTVTPNNATAPDGTQTASLNTATANSSTGAGNYTATGISVTSGLNYTASVHLKNGTSTYGVLNVNHSSGGYVAAVINLTTGVITSVGLLAATMFTNVTTKSTFIGNGWWRVEITWTAGVTGTVPYIWGQCNSATPTFQAGGNVSVTAGQTNYVWGGQVEQASAASSYIPTYNAITNLLPQSNYLANSPWVNIANAVATNNAAIAPDGTQTASLVTVGSTIGGIRIAVPVTASTTYTFSFYVKLGTLTSPKYSVFNLTAGSELIGATSYSATSTGWTRVQVTFTTPAGCTSVGCYPWRDGGVAGTMWVWGCQLETGAVASQLVAVSPAVTNLNIQSNFASGWNLQGSTLTSGATDPSGGVTAWTLGASATAGSCPFNANVAPTSVANAPYTYSAYIKAGTSQYAILEIASSSGNYVSAVFDVLNGLVTKTQTGGVFTLINAAIKQSTNGFYRCEITFQTSSAVAMPALIGNATSPTPTLSTTYGLPTTITGGITTIFCWTQIEAGYGFNQYVATTTASASAVAQTSANQVAQSSASRAPDLLSFGSALGLSFNNVKTIQAQGSFLNYNAGLYGGLVLVNDGTSANSIKLGAYDTTGNFGAQIVIGTIAAKTLNSAGGIANPSTSRKQAISFGNNQTLIAQNGVTVNDASNIPNTYSGSPVFNQFIVGALPFQSPAQCNGYVQKIQLFDTSLNQSQLNALTK